jgi:acetyltransferase
MMYPSLCAILEPPAPVAGSSRAHTRCAPPECDTIPVITVRGRVLRVHTTTSGDMPLLVDLLARLSARTAQLRFFRPLKSIEAIWDEAVRVAGSNPRLQTALVATALEAGQARAVAVAELAHDPGDPAVAEFAVVVRDDFQHEGVGKMLAQLLVQVAMLRGVAPLRASMLAENQTSRKLLRGIGLPYTLEARRGEITALLRLPRG